MKSTDVLRACVFKLRPVVWQSDGGLSRNHPVDFSTPSKPTAHVFSRVSTALASIAPNPALEHKSNALKLCVRVFSNRDLLVGKPTVSCHEISPSTFFTSPSPSVHVFFPHIPMTPTSIEKRHYHQKRHHGTLHFLPKNYCIRYILASARMDRCIIIKNTIVEPLSELIVVVMTIIAQHLCKSAKTEKLWLCQTGKVHTFPM